jgi:hypothetical protein
MFLIFCGAISRRLGVSFAHVCALLRVSVVAISDLLGRLFRAAAVQVGQKVRIRSSSVAAREWHVPRGAEGTILCRYRLLKGGDSAPFRLDVRFSSKLVVWGAPNRHAAGQPQRKAAINLQAGQGGNAQTIDRRRVGQTDANTGSSMLVYATLTSSGKEPSHAPCELAR